MPSQPTVCYRLARPGQYPTVTLIFPFRPASSMISFLRSRRFQGLRSMVAFLIGVCAGWRSRRNTVRGFLHDFLDGNRLRSVDELPLPKISVPF